MSFIQRKINASIVFGAGADGLNAGRTVELSGYRMIANATQAGGAGMGQLQLRIFGLNPSLMNDLSTVGKQPMAFARNTITVFAGDDAAGMSQFYQGTIIAAYADMTASPEVSFLITANVGTIEAITPLPASSYAGNADAAIILSNLAKQLNLTFENNGVSVILNNPVLPGAGRQQIESCAKAANIDWVIDNGVLAIWKKGASRSTPDPILISPDTGMVGYPTYTATGVIVTILYNPTIIFGQLVKVTSSITAACGMWRVLVLTHELSAEYPGGPWFSQLQLVRPDVLVVA
jgi:hypothetical protein